MVKVLEHNSPKTAALILRFGLAFVLIYAAISAFQQPFEWIGYVPSQLSHVVAPATALKLLSILQLIIGGWLIIGKYTKYAALATALVLFGVIVTNGSQLIITFRDIGLLAAAAALFLL
jgi:uncharacterized membrane protein YphA (DoxX/SURF4 family)